jgi:CRISPR-associated protein Cas2
VEVLVSYDINTQTAEGEARLRRVAKVCEGFGQRVQQSVFECVLDESGLDALQAALLEVIYDRVDSVRIYRLREPHERFTTILGRPLAFDIRDPLIL